VVRLAGNQRVFVREATGLVRSISAYDAFFMNAVLFGATWSIIYASEYAPLYGGDPITSLIETAPGVLALLGIYYVFQVSMPRSGGDYVFVGRSLHPALGLTESFLGGAGFFAWFWIGDAATVFSTQGLAQTLAVYGSLTGQSGAIAAANSLAEPLVIFVLGTIAIAVFISIVALRNRLYFRIQNIGIIISIVALILIIALLASTNQSSFAAALDAYANRQGIVLTPGAYENITNTGAGYWGGSVPTAPTSGYTFMLIPLWFTAIVWFNASTYVSGEIKNIRSSAKLSVFGSFIVFFGFTLAVLGLSYANLGPNFLAGSGFYAFGYATNPLPVIPNLLFYAGVLTQSPILVLIIGIGVVAGFILTVPLQTVIMSRNLLAYSFDRLAPVSFSKVSDRWHSPLVAILIAASGGEAFLIFLSGIIGPATSGLAFLLYSYAALGQIAVNFTLVAIAAIAFPFLKKNLYQSTCPIKRKVAGLPVISWLGIIALVYCVGTVGYYSYNYTFYLGAGTLASQLYFPFFGIVAAVFVFCIVWYYVARAIRIRSGIPFDLAFQEIPPE
jgi:basic amino acid/polyamine antiporter, APA family